MVVAVNTNKHVPVTLANMNANDAAASSFVPNRPYTKSKMTVYRTDSINNLLRTAKNKSSASYDEMCERSINKIQSTDSKYFIILTTKKRFTLYINIVKMYEIITGTANLNKAFVSCFTS